MPAQKQNNGVDVILIPMHNFLFPRRVSAFRASVQKLKGTIDAFNILKKTNLTEQRQVIGQDTFV
jgi:hypothetical protein